MSRCRCAGACPCRIAAGAGVSITGNGDEATPYVVSAGLTALPTLLTAEVPLATDTAPCAAAPNWATLKKADTTTDWAWSFVSPEKVDCLVMVSAYLSKTVASGNLSFALRFSNGVYLQDPGTPTYYTARTMRNGLAATGGASFHSAFALESVVGGGDNSVPSGTTVVTARYAWDGAASAASVDYLSFRIIVLGQAI
ncbi:MAG: hypothetical protein E4H44_00315 [Candidatus Aminicenantes bacterium]|nr:MAG: hypothetical protein E4H44_00315 [Candidatus Aminicenantes bacterium]